PTEEQGPLSNPHRDEVEWRLALEGLVLWAVNAGEGDDHPSSRDPLPAEGPAPTVRAAHARIIGVLAAAWFRAPLAPQLVAVTAVEEGAVDGGGPRRWLRRHELVLDAEDGRAAGQAAPVRDHPVA